MVFGSSACQFKTLDIERISERLFEQEKIRQKLCRHFCIKDVGDPVKMANRLVNSMGQITPRDGGTEDLEDNRIVVFRAAALALASNMRQWSRVLNCLGKFESLLEQKVREGQLSCARDTPLRLERRHYRIEFLSGGDGSNAERLQFHEGRQPCLGARGVCREKGQGVRGGLLEDHHGVGVCRKT